MTRKQLDTFDAVGQHFVCTTTREQWERDRAAAVAVHVVAPEVHVGVGEWS